MTQTETSAALAVDPGARDACLRPSITADLAARLVQSVRVAGEEAGKGFVVAVVDESGLLKAFLRMEGTRRLSIDVATNKAYTAVSGRPTHLWHETLEKDAVLGAGARGAIDRLVTLGGGYPVIVGGEVVGGIGVAGGHYTEDMAAATRALSDAGLKSQW